MLVSPGSATTSKADTFAEWAGEYVLLEGKPPYHPGDLSALYLYGMMNRLRCSRQLESACHNRLDVIWLMQGQKPDHSTIASFVRQHGKPLGKLFRDVVGVAVRAGLVGLDNMTEKHKLAKMRRQRDRLNQALGQIERRRQECPSGKPPKAIASTTDPECRSMKDKEGRSKPKLQRTGSGG